MNRKEYEALEPGFKAMAERDNFIDATVRFALPLTFAIGALFGAAVTLAVML